MIDIEGWGLRQGVLEVVNPTNIQIGEREYGVRRVETDTSIPGYSVDVLEFVDAEIATTMDAAIITGESNCPSPIQRYFGERVYIEKIIEGSAIWIGVSPEGEVVAYEFDAREGGDNEINVFGAGWMGSWIAGSEGVKFLEVCVPAFEDDGTIEVARPEDEEVAGVAIPLLFRAMYYSLMELSWVEGEEPIELVGTRLRLKQFEVDDAQEIFALIDRNKEHLSQNDDPTAGKYKALRQVVESIVHPDPKKPGRKRFGIWNEKGELVGSVNITPDKNDPTSAEIGYYLGSEFMGRGCMTEAASMLTAFAFDELECEVVYGMVDERNARSKAVLERVGYQIVSHTDGEYRLEIRKKVMGSYYDTFG